MTISNIVNNLNLNRVDVLHQKYQQFLHEFRGEKNVLERLYLVDISVNYLKTNYIAESKNLKSWAVVVVFRLYKHDKTTEADVYKIIDDFVANYKKHIQAYIEDIAMFASDYDREVGFITYYLEKIKGS